MSEPAAPVGQIVFGDNLPFLQTLPAASIDLIYIDPPFNTGRTQSHTPIKTRRATEADAGDRRGFQGRSYHSTRLDERAYADDFGAAYLEAFLAPRLAQARRLLAPHGTLYVHLDYREVHYVKVLLDTIFGRANFLNEIIWAYDFGGKAKSRWPAKHDNILVYVQDPARYFFDSQAVDREPYMAPGLVGPEKAARGKLPTDTWWHTIVGTNSHERTGYPTQKPLAIINRILRASSRPGDLVLDFFAGSGTVGASCLELGRRFILVDDNPQALAVMAARFAGQPGLAWVNWDL